MSKTKTTEPEEYELYSEPTEALGALEGQRGDVYCTPETAVGVLAAFLGEFGETESDAAYEIRTRVAEECRIAHDARGIVHNVDPFNTVLGWDDVSGILADAVGAEHGDGKSVGHARSARERHEETVRNIRETLGLVPEAE